ncbi:SCP2 sterol-binding domain-containing protein [Actinocorallia sp. B10E7]|uniref:SCP2 sterol-binding domain-containing protein n=1 Tax=Actinocorallia sp. B10E7 TaxID=3153558 RepID=UPI00325CF685
MSLQSREEVRTYLGGVFETAFADPELASKLKETGLVLQFDYSDPETVITVDTASGSVVLGTIDGRSPAATLSMTAGVANRYWQGKVSLPLAMAKGQIKVAGNVAGLLKIAPLGKKLYPIYVQRLKDDGRDDLIAA